MKLLVDMFPAQSLSRLRDIGRYTRLLVASLAQTSGDNQLVVLADPNYSQSFEKLRQEFTRLLPRGSFLPYSHEPIIGSGKARKLQTIAAECLKKQAFDMVNPDMVLYPSLFEFRHNEHGIVPFPDAVFPSAKRAAILYDFIPFIFQNEYSLDKAAKNEYYEILSQLNKFDLFLSISETTRQDAINLLGISSEKIINILGAPNPIFSKKELSEVEKSQVLDRFGVSRPFIFYVSGDDFRKNKAGLIRAYAKLPREVIASHQLVINSGEENINGLLKLAIGFGLSVKDIILLPRVDDNDLINLLNLCKLFVFPSLYEGFGLPILDAMACGAPVIAANNSSLPDVIGRSDALFDASNEDEITAAILKAVNDDAFRWDLSAYGLQRARQFSWESSANQTWDRIGSLLDRKSDFPVEIDNNRLRIAYVSPLPPQRSGISEYSADLLPYLVKYFNVDLFVDIGIDVDENIKRQFQIFPLTQLLANKENYATVVYQQGNSAFHSHMQQLQQQFPGVVVLHDFFLSHLVAHETVPSGTFTKCLDESHGMRSLIDFQLRGLDVIWDWPINWPILRHARELIVHSNFLNELCKQYFGGGWTPNFNVVKQIYVNQLHYVDDSARLASRYKLKIEPDDFVCCTFGMITPHKLPELLIKSVPFMLNSIGNHVRLVFIGEFGSLEYQNEIMGLVNNLKLSGHIKFIGYASREDYLNYISCANLAIQLRARSRGETSRAVLDCLGYGLPTIVNSHGTLNDYDNETVFKISTYPSPEELGAAVTQIYSNYSSALEIGNNARKQINEQHSPESVAREYAKIIYRAACTDERRLFAPLWDNLADSEVKKERIVSEADHAALNMALRNQPRILIDVTNTDIHDLKTGIQRVVKEFSKELISLDSKAVHVELVRLESGKLWRATHFAEKLFGLPSLSMEDNTPIIPQLGDHLFMLDTSWNLYTKFLPVFEKVRENGGRIHTMIYDLIPVLLPEMTTPDTAYLFGEWIKLAIKNSDGIICISKTVSDAVVDYCKDNKLVDHYLDISYVHLGANIEPTNVEEKINREILDYLSQCTPLFLTVGTIEPRKNHPFILDAFEQLWAQGHNFYLCFTGKIGWKVEDLEKRIRNHPELGKRFLFFENPTDAEINALYQSATALVFASIAEGFGLPIVEAALHKVPVITSDIPVFREVGGEGVKYFSLSSPEHLAEAVIEMSQLTAEERVAMASKIKPLTWRQSAEWLIEVLDGKKKYVTLPSD